LGIYIFTCRPKSTPRRKRRRELPNVLIPIFQPPTDGPISLATKINPSLNILKNKNLSLSSPNPLKKTEAVTSPKKEEYVRKEHNIVAFDAKKKFRGEHGPMKTVKGGFKAEKLEQRKFQLDTIRNPSPLKILPVKKKTRATMTNQSRIKPKKLYQPLKNQSSRSNLKNNPKRSKSPKNSKKKSRLKNFYRNSRLM
jgi:hypothetical protein